jgi:hypothetical protein
MHDTTASERASGFSDGVDPTKAPRRSEAWQRSQACRLTDFSLQGVGELQAEVGVLQVMVSTGIGTYIVL